MAAAALTLLGKGTGTAQGHHLVTGQRLAVSGVGPQPLATGGALPEPVLCAARALPAWLCFPLPLRRPG